MLNMITYLGLPGNQTLDNRILSVDIASTLFYWDHLSAPDAAQSSEHHIKPEVSGTADAGDTVSAIQQAAGSASQATGDADQAVR